MIDKAMAMLIEIPASYLNKWQFSIDLLAQLFAVPTVLLMRMHEDSYEVLVRNQTADCPYHVNFKQKRFSNCYNDGVINQGQLLSVEYAPDDSVWCSSPDIENGIHSYLGTPIRWHDHTIFGTLSLMSPDPHHYSEFNKNVFLQFLNSIEQDLKILAHEKVIDQQLAQLKQGSRNLIRAREKGRLVLSLKTNFLNFISHTIRTSLNGILGAGYLLSDSDSRQDKIQYINSINASSETTLTLLGDIMDYSKFAEGNISLSKQAFNLDAIIQQVVDTYQEKHLNSHIVFVNSDAEDKLWFLGDSIRIHQILANIVRNTLKDGVQGCIYIERVFTEAKTINIGLSGNGLYTEGLKHLFYEYKPFLSGQSYQDISTDLGLSVCKKLIGLMQGNIKVTGSGESLCLNIELPLTQIKSEPTRELDKNYAEQVPPIRILVAEDNPTDQMVIEGFLRKLKQNASYAANGQQAAEQYIQQAQLGNHFELVLMDCEMPIMDGLSASQKIRNFEKKHNIPRCNIVALSAHAMAEFGQRCLNAGMDRHMTKPIRLRGLKEILWLVSKYHSPVLPRQNKAG